MKPPFKTSFLTENSFHESQPQESTILRDLEAYKPTILIIDDDPTSISVLFNYLEDSGLRILVEVDGTKAINNLAVTKPDLILLDIRMPVIDGYEICRQIKANIDTTHIPIIFLTALTDLQDKIRGFKEGAVDYITKPLQYEEVVARVHTHLTIWSLQRQLADQNRHLEELNLNKNKFFSIIAHDLRGPFFNLHTEIERLKSTPDLPLEECKDTIPSLYESSKRISTLLDNLLAWSKIQMDVVVCKPVHVVIMDLVSECISDFSDLIADKEIVVMNRIDPSFVAFVDREMLKLIVRNLLSNALKFSYRAGEISLDAKQTSEHSTIEIQDHGAGMESETLHHLFQLKNIRSQLGTENEKGTGLGLLLVKDFVEMNHGTIQVESQKDQGTHVVVSLPLQAPFLSPL